MLLLFNSLSAPESKKLANLAAPSKLQFALLHEDDIKSPEKIEVPLYLAAGITRQPITELLLPTHSIIFHAAKVLLHYICPRDSIMFTPISNDVAHFPQNMARHQRWVFVESH